MTTEFLKHVYFNGPQIFLKVNFFKCVLPYLKIYTIGYGKNTLNAKMYGYRNSQKDDFLNWSFDTVGGSNREQLFVLYLSHGSNREQSVLYSCHPLS